MTDVAISETQRHHVFAILGEEGTDWLRRLPEIVDRCAREWSLTVGPPFPGVWFNYVAEAWLADGTPAVLKVCFLHGEFYSEAEALRLYGGNGMVRLLRSDLSSGVLLLERLAPGTSLEALSIENDRAAMAIAASAMRGLRHPVPADHPFPTVAGWGLGFERYRRAFPSGGPLPTDAVDRAERLFHDLAASQGPAVVLHGDLHHGNILAAQREPWLVIDPKGLAGEPEYETGALLRNPWPSLLQHPDPERILASRVDQLSEDLDFDRTRVRSWAVAQGVLSALWTIEDGGGDWQFAMTCAELIAAGGPVG